MISRHYGSLLYWKQLFACYLGGRSAIYLNIEAVSVNFLMNSSLFDEGFSTRLALSSSESDLWACYKPTFVFRLGKIIYSSCYLRCSSNYLHRGVFRAIRKASYHDHWALPHMVYQDEMTFDYYQCQAIFNTSFSSSHSYEASSASTFTCVSLLCYNRDLHHSQLLFLRLFGSDVKKESYRFCYLETLVIRSK